MRNKHILALAIILTIVVWALPCAETYAQCKSFVKVNCQPELPPYVHDGSYQAVIMNEGEEAEIYKTIFAGQRYRLFICADSRLPGVEFVVSDIHRNILYDNRKDNNAQYWDFKANTSQQIKVTVRVPKSKKTGSSESELVFGCVGILFGLMDK